MKIDGWGVLWKMKGIRRKQDKGEIMQSYEAGV